MAKTYRISIIVEQIDPACSASPEYVPERVQLDVIGHYQALPQALRIAREIARAERRSDDHAADLP